MISSCSHRLRLAERLTWYICPVCSAKVFVEIKETLPGGRAITLWGVATGTLNGAEGWEARAHEHLEDTRDGGWAGLVREWGGKEVERWPHGLWQGKKLGSVQRGGVGKASDEERVEGWCKCRSVRFRVTRKAGERFPARLCMCDACRGTSGTEVAGWAEVPSGCLQLGWEGEGSGVSEVGKWQALKNYVATPGEVRYSCKTCGAPAFIVSDAEAEKIRAAAGLLDAPEGARAEGWLAWQMNSIDGEKEAMRRHPTLVEALRHELGRASGENPTHGVVQQPMKTSG
ncbi:hypothetical protein K461DRAFT_159533 [Myriangium duriaei CBS 260.36]|uniref:CENP-V/GFA domain-containing protein n=1 Tax=Myriangium duriaei CBS 260.36 TaxID=1168546 RepID=A0A9P4IZU2_9PEZI|nr:hypothetical protein K461DRAFT_159533 [Myriangium duriaei CBS 260.36]